MILIWFENEMRKNTRGNVKCKKTEEVISKISIE